MAPFSVSIRLVGPGLRVMCTCRTLLYLHLTCGTRRLACHLWTLSPSDLWDLTVCVSLVNLFSNRPVRPSGLCVMCTYGTILHLHSTCGTRRLACHLLPPGFNKFKLKKTMRPRCQTQDPEQGIDLPHHYARRLVVLTCLWSSICSLCGHVDLYIGYIPCKWKQICAHWTCGSGGGNEGS
jgi:hypothetical protein